MTTRLVVCADWPGALVVMAVAALAGCAAPPKVPARDSLFERQPTGPACRIDGCCEGHGAVAYLQRDLAVMCTDGSTSQTCDCHQ